MLVIVHWRHKKKKSLRFAVHTHLQKHTTAIYVCAFKYKQQANVHYKYDPSEKSPKLKCKSHTPCLI